MKRIALSIVLLTVSSGVAWGVWRFDRPNFYSDYQLPPTQTPQPRAPWAEYVDLALLIVALSVASWLALKKRSRRWIYVVTLLSLLYFGFYRRGCVCPIGAIQNVTLALADAEYAIPLAVLGFFVAPLVFTLLFGRAFCAAVCPLGAVQELVVAKPLKLPLWLQESLGLLAYVYLAAAVLFAATGSTFLICQYDPFVAFFRVSGTMNMLVLGASFLVIGLFIGRPYCRFLCPYGALLRLLGRLSWLRVTITPADCVRCRLCEDSCPYGAIRKPTGGLPSARRGEGKGRLAWLLALLPVLVAGGAWLGWELGEPFSRMHFTVRLADRVMLEATGAVQGTTDASAAFYANHPSAEDAKALYDESAGIQDAFAAGTAIMGGFVGLVVGLKLLGLSVRRRRVDYEADRGICVACGRCFEYCPVEVERRRRLQEQPRVPRM